MNQLLEVHAEELVWLGTQRKHMGSVLGSRLRLSPCTRKSPALPDPCRERMPAGWPGAVSAWEVRRPLCAARQCHSFCFISSGHTFFSFVNVKHANSL